MLSAVKVSYVKCSSGLLVFLIFSNKRAVLALVRSDLQTLELSATVEWSLPNLHNVWKQGSVSVS